MRNFTTIFNQVLNIIPYWQIQKAVEEFNGDKYVKKFKTYHEFVALLYAQITEKDSLRDIERPINLVKNKIQFFHCRKSRNQHYLMLLITEIAEYSKKYLAYFLKKHCN